MIALFGISVVGGVGVASVVAAVPSVFVTAAAGGCASMNAVFAEVPVVSNNGAFADDDDDSEDKLLFAESTAAAPAA